MNPPTVLHYAMRPRHVLLLALTLSGCQRASTRPLPASSARQFTTAQAADAPQPSEEQIVALEKSVDPPSVAPVLDPVEGKAALAAYRSALVSLCESKLGESATAADGRSALGVDPAVASHLCGTTSSAGTALASGALLERGAQEVLLDVPSGLSGASGDRALLLMRKEGARYHPLKQLALGKGFEARARFTVASGTDVLLLCQHAGSMGVYLSTCGFLGHGSFRENLGTSESSNAETNEIELVRVTSCGKGASVELGDISLEGDRLHVGLVVEHFVLERKGAEEASGTFCSRRLSQDRKTLLLEYRFDGSQPVRLTRSLAEVDEALAAY